MSCVRQRRLTEAERAELWRRWRAGESASAIGRALGRGPATIFYAVRATGGIGPPARSRSRWALTAEDRETLSRGLAAGWSLRHISRVVGRAPSTISREVRRNGGRLAYRGAAAEAAAWVRGHRPKPCRLATRPRLRAMVARKLARQWSPQQIAGWLRRRFPDDGEMHLSHETIYLSLFVQTRGVLKRALLAHLRRRRLVRRARTARGTGHGRGRIVDAVPIRERPAAVEDRAVPGHWEGDLLLGGRQSQIVTLVERHSRYVLLARVARRDTQAVVQALTRSVRRLPTHLVASLTWDRGTELAAHRAFTVATNVRVYFCDPHSPWQRGSNENTNGLLRQYLPSGVNVSALTQRQLDTIARKLNTRPRKTLGYATPADTLAQAVASTP
jgi:IS30 family transposase